MAEAKHGTWFVVWWALTVRCSDETLDFALLNKVEIIIKHGKKGTGGYGLKVICLGVKSTQVWICDGW